jgi:hypothetical protein
MIGYGVYDGIWRGFGLLVPSLLLRQTHVIRGTKEKITLACRSTVNVNGIALFIIIDSW